MKAILIAGASGQVGFELMRCAWRPDVEPIGPGRDELDLSDVSAVERVIAEKSVAAVINAAAYTAVDKAETEVEAAYAANEGLPASLAEATRQAGVPLIHVSTDYVFDGASPRPYEVDAPIAPLGVYGASKAAGERAVREGNPRSAIVRTAWVVSDRRSNFAKTMLRLGREREVVRVVADQHGSPTIAADLAAALATIALGMIDDPAAPSGTFHFANAGETSWYGFAEAIFAQSAKLGEPTPRLEAIATADYPTPARRPANSLLSTRRIEAEYGIRPAPWRDRLPALVKKIIAEQD